MESIIANVIEKSLVGGAFIYLLYMFVTRFSVSQENIVRGLSDIASKMTDISHTLANLDERVRKLEGEKKDV